MARPTQEVITECAECLYQHRATYYGENVPEGHHLPPGWKLVYLPPDTDNPVPLCRVCIEYDEVEYTPHFEYNENAPVGR